MIKKGAVVCRRELQTISLVTDTGDVRKMKKRGRRERETERKWTKVMHIMKYRS